MSILASTKFLYRAEPGAPPADLPAGSAYAISDLELAWRLSFFLWSQGPDETLLAARGRGHAATSPPCSSGKCAACWPTSARARSSRISRSSGSACAASKPSTRIRGSTRISTRTCAAHSRRRWSSISTASCASAESVVDLLTANHTFVNERLARHYGLPDVRGDQFRRVELDDSHRFGLFGKGSVLMVTSYPDRTSPVLRGAWIMEQILAAPPNPPPPGVETDLGTPSAKCRNPCASGSRCTARSLVQPVPRRHRSARPGAREFQRRRRVAHARARQRRARRFDGHDVDRAAGQQPRGAARGAREPIRRCSCTR